MSDTPFVIKPLNGPDLDAMIREPDTSDEAAVRRWFKAQAAAFSCGHDDLDRYLRAQMTQDLRRDVAKPFVLVEVAYHEPWPATTPSLRHLFVSPIFLLKRSNGCHDILITLPF